jgi:hypothetical protein
MPTGGRSPVQLFYHIVLPQVLLPGARLLLVCRERWLLVACNLPRLVTPHGSSRTVRKQLNSLYSVLAYAFIS